MLKETLFELSIPYIVIAGDADPELAAIANSINAFVLASDTDFCVMDLNKGFLPFEDFNWKQVCTSLRCCINSPRAIRQLPLLVANFFCVYGCV